MWVGECLCPSMQSIKPHLTLGTLGPDLKGRREAGSICLTLGRGLPTGTMRLRSGCPRPAWCCCPSLSLCCSGPSTVTTCYTRAWWRSLSLTCCGPSPVSVLPPLPQPHSLNPPPPSPDQPPLPPTGALTQAIRNFAKSLESWLTHAMVNIPEEMLRVKVRGPAWGQPGPSLWALGPRSGG